MNIHISCKIYQQQLSVLIDLETGSKSDLLSYNIFIFPMFKNEIELNSVLKSSIVVKFTFAYI